MYSSIENIRLPFSSEGLLPSMFEKNESSKENVYFRRKGQLSVESDETGNRIGYYVLRGEYLRIRRSSRLQNQVVDMSRLRFSWISKWIADETTVANCEISWFVSVTEEPILGLHESVHWHLMQEIAIVFRVGIAAKVRCNCLTVGKMMRYNNVGFSDFVIEELVALFCTVVIPIAEVFDMTEITKEVVVLPTIRLKRKPERAADETLIVNRDRFVIEELHTFRQSSTNVLDCCEVAAIVFVITENVDNWLPADLACGFFEEDRKRTAFNNTNIARKDENVEEFGIETPDKAFASILMEFRMNVTD